MKIEVINESGYEAALLGMGLSFGKTSGMLCKDFKDAMEENSWGLTDEADNNITIARSLKERSVKLAHKQGGHNSFLELMLVWVDVTAKMKWWKQADRYRISSKLSESTMHTVIKKPLTLKDFDIPKNVSAVKTLELHVMNINEYIKQGDFESVTDLLPECFLQRRIWCMSYKTLQNICNQRKDHKLPEWHYFCNEVLKQVEHPEYIKEE